MKLLEYAEDVSERDTMRIPIPQIVEVDIPVSIDRPQSIGSFVKTNKLWIILLASSTLSLIAVFTGFAGSYAKYMMSIGQSPYTAECFIQYTPDNIIIVQLDGGDAGYLCQETSLKSNGAWILYSNPATPIAGIACTVHVGHETYTVYDEGYTRGMNITHRLSYDYICARLGFDGRLPEQGF